MFDRDFVAKADANFPSNPSKRNLPTVQGVLLLFDQRNGAPLAVMDSMEITLRRTAAATPMSSSPARPHACRFCSRQRRGPSSPRSARTIPM